MGTDIWFNVQVDDGPHNWVDRLPDFGLINGDKWDVGFDTEPIKGAIAPPYYTRTEHEGVYGCSGEGRYGDEENITKWAQSFTLMVLGSTVTVNTEWHADGYGEEMNVYRNGQVVMPESTYNRQVPANLDDLMTEGLRVLKLYDDDDEPASLHGHIMQEARLAGALRSLLEGLHQ